MKPLFKEFMKLRDSSSFNIWGDILPNPDRVFRASGNSYSKYRELLNDAHLWSCVQSRKSGSLSIPYYFKGERAELMNEIFADIDVKSFMEDVLDSLLYGFQPIEIYWKSDRGYIIPEKLIAKPQEAFLVDKENKMVFKKSKGFAELPKYKFLDIRYRASFDNPYGDALLSKCYWPLQFKKGSIRFWVNFMEKYGMPLVLGQFKRGAGDEEAENLAQVLASMSEDSVIVTPDDIDIRMEEPHRYSSVRLYNEMIKLCNTEISKAILSQTLTTEVGTGSKAAADTHFKIRAELIKSDMRLIENVFDLLLQNIEEINFNDGKRTKFLFRKDLLEDKALPDKELLSMSGIRLSKEYFKRVYELNDEDFESEV